MNTNDLVKIALDLANLTELPADSGITVEGENIKKVLIGIDMDTPELLLAEKMEFDCVVSHHPKTGSQVVDFDKVMDVQIDKMVEFGVPINRAQKALSKKKNSVNIGSHVSNYDRVASFAKLMDMPYLNIHMPADMIGEKFTQEYLDTAFANEPKATLQDVCDKLNELPIYKDALASPVVRVGSPSSYAGKIAVLFAGGTNGGSDVYKSYFDAGVGTIVCMHTPENVIKDVREQNIGNVIVAGHMASDSIGLNKLIEAWENAGFEVVKMSGIL